MKRIVAAIVVFSALVAAGQTSPRRTAPEKPPALAVEHSQATFRSYSRLVLVDVVVRDRRGQAVNDLQQSDFAVYENGKLQKIAFFTAKPDEVPAGEHLSANGNGVYSNRPQDKPTTGSPVILLLDLLNTPAGDRAYAREAMLGFIRKQLKSGQPVSIFVLGNKLELLQGFTMDRGALEAAVVNDKTNPSDPRLNQHDVDLVENLAYNLGDAELKALAEALRSWEDSLRVEKDYERVDTTVSAMATLARVTSGMPGRKSLIWMTAAFPMVLQYTTPTAVQLRSPLKQSVVLEGLVKQATKLLNDSRIALYPVDVRGLISQPMIPIEQQQSVEWARNPAKMNEQMDKGRDDIREGQESMKRLAELTGGRAFVNRNDVELAVAAATQDNAQSYTIGYYPENKDFKGEFRTIRVKAIRSGLQLNHRQGYYAPDITGRRTAQGKAAARKALEEALQFDPATSSQVELLLHLEPAQPKAGAPLKVEFFVKGQSVEFVPDKENRTADLTFGVSVRNEKNTVSMEMMDRDIALPQEAYERAMNSGLTLSLPLTLAKGKYRMRAGVRDNTTGKIGTIDVPVEVE